MNEPFTFELCVGKELRCGGAFVLCSDLSARSTVMGRPSSKQDGRANALSKGRFDIDKDNDDLFEAALSDE